MVSDHTIMKIQAIILFGTIFFVSQLTAQKTPEPKFSDIVKTTNSPYAKLKSVNLADVTWTEGFWKNRVDMVRNITIPHLYNVMNIEDQGKSVHNLKLAAGLNKGTYKGNNWQDAWLYKWIEMAAVSYAATKDKELDLQMDTLISIIGLAQEEDGYISTNIQLRDFKRFEDPNQHEWYNMGHLLTAAALHHRLTGKSGFLEIAIKVCDFGYFMYREHNKEMAHFPLNPSIIMGAVEMYRETGDKKHLELAKMVVDNRGKYPKGTDMWQDRIPLREENEVMGHAVWYTYLYAGAADVFMETGDETLLVALNRLWDDLVENKLYVHGGTCAIYRGFGFRKDGKFWTADQVHEAVGMPHQQPQAYGYNETCGQVGNFMWNYRMLCISAEPRFAEIMENTMFNGFLGSMGQDGKSFFYVNPLRWHGHEQIPLSSLERGIPGSNKIGTCCPTNYSRTLVELQGMLYSKSENMFWIHHYGANKYDDGDIILEQKTNFPWDGQIVLEVEKIPENYDLNIRIPDWATGAEVSINEKKIENVKASSYLRLSGLKNKGNTITIRFPVKARLVTGNPKIEETRNQVAIKCGPVLYAMEEVDLPEGIDFDEVVIPSNIQFDQKNMPGLFSGVNILEGKAKYYKKQNWDKIMYQDFQKPRFRDFYLHLIPYYCWANRGVSKMTVWMPIDY